jgi:hypothetical protein
LLSKVWFPRHWLDFVRKLTCSWSRGRFAQMGVCSIFGYLMYFAYSCIN